MHPIRLALALGAAALALAVPRLAFPCGGTFCSAQTPIPVDQNAERILFEVNGDGTISAHVEISYTGDPSAFSWVVPVPDTPALGEVPPSALRLLDAATAPQFVAPPLSFDACSQGGGGFSLGCACGARAGVADMAGADAGAGGPGGVIVEDLPRVGPFDPEVVSSTDPRALIDWLNTNEYVITQAMEPFVAAYVDAGMRFLAMKLAPGAGTSDIQPIKMTYPGDAPMIPLMLTAVGAEPEMSIVVLITGAQRYEPVNYRSLVIRTNDVHMDPLSGRTNYFALVSHRIDLAGGRAFVTQFSDRARSVSLDGIFLGAPDETEARDYAEGVLQRQPWITRFYTRLSPWEMTEDPTFATSTGGDVPRTHNLSTRPAVDACGSSRVLCGTTYCGPGSSCATNIAGGEGCVCAAGTRARLVSDPMFPGTQAVYCQREDFDVLQGVVGAFDPCINLDCGSGTCAVVGGFPTCGCAAGHAAFATASGLRCMKAEETFGVEILDWPPPAEPQRITGPVGASAGGSWAGMILFSLLLLGVRMLRLR